MVSVSTAAFLGLTKVLRHLGTTVKDAVSIHKVCFERKA